jgi:hypothetical protein
MRRIAYLSLFVLLCACSQASEAPAQFRVRFETSKGPFVVEVHRQWAPNGGIAFMN